MRKHPMQKLIVDEYNVIRFQNNEIAESILAEPGIVQVFNHAGYCRKCRQPLAGATVDLTKLKMRIAEEIKKAMSMRNEK